MASSLAAAIKNEFGVSVKLIDGHNGIYEVAVNDTVVYSSNNACSSGFPSDDVIFQEIQKYKEPLPDEEKTVIHENVIIGEDGAPFCELPARPSDDLVE